MANLKTIKFRYFFFTKSYLGKLLRNPKVIPNRLERRRAMAKDMKPEPKEWNFRRLKILPLGAKEKLALKPSFQEGAGLVVLIDGSNILRFWAIWKNEIKTQSLFCTLKMCAASR